MFTKILVAVDFESQSDEAIRTAVGLARDTEASITLAHVYDVEGVTRASSYVRYTPDERLRVAGDLQQRLDSLKTRLLHGGVRHVETCLSGGKPAPEILRLARAGDHDLIIMGTHGRTGICLKLLGSVSQGVLGGALASVLVVRSQAREVIRKAAREPIEGCIAPDAR
jgi:nucleotide-binding universal stress UspA family protein